MTLTSAIWDLKIASKTSEIYGGVESSMIFNILCVNVNTTSSNESFENKLCFKRMKIFNYHSTKKSNVEET